MTILLVIIYVIVCLFLVLVVLLQQGKGADLAGAFGGGGSQTSFGPRSATNIMHRLTTASFVLFVVLSMTLAILSGKQRGSVMEDVPVAPEPQAAVEVEGGAAGDAAVMEPAAVDEGDAEAPAPAEESTDTGSEPAPDDAQ